MKSTRTPDSLSLLCFALCGFLSGTGGQLAAATNTVTSLADNGPGSLRQAIALAVAGDTINFAVTGTIPLQSQLEIDKSLFIAGPGATALTLSGQGTVRVLAISGGTVLINGLTVADGSASVSGGIDIDGGALVTITNCVLRGNIAYEGGGGGGAIRNWSSTLQIESCTFAGNSAVGAGGAIQNLGTTSLRNSTFSGNSASMGGALHNVNYQTLSIWNCTLYKNTASDYGGGILGSSAVGSSIIAGNSAALGPDCDGNINSFDFNLIQNTNGCTVTGSKSHNLLGVDPLLGPLRDNGGPTPTHALRFDSPALDKGQSNGTTTDQRGKPRIVNLPGIENAADGCDIGACEREDAIPQPEPTNKVTTLADDGPGSLRQAIVDAAPGATITFDVTGQINLTSTELTILTNLTLSGPGPALLTISGAGAKRAFNITGGDVSIAGLTIANAVNLACEPYFEAQGGAIRNAGQLTLSNAVLSGNNVGPARDGSGSGKGGAVYNSGTLAIFRCTLTGNQASPPFQSGSNGNRGGAIFNTGTLLASEATFQGNRAQARGGGIYSSGALTLSNCAFFANSADAGGGGVYNETNGTLTLLESELSTNSCLAGSGGGVDNAGKACVLSSILYSNVTDMDGSGINNTGEIGVTNSTVQLNYCVHGGGGGLYNSGSMAVEGCLIADNWVSVQGSLGGGIGNSGTLSVNHTTVISNTAPLGGGVGNQGPVASLTVDNSTLAANFAMSFGGGLYTWSSGSDKPTDRVVATLRNTTISGNTAQKKRTAGGVDATTYAGNVIVNLSHCTIVSNTCTANTVPATGGIYSGKLGTSGSATVNLYSTILADNLTPYLPGAGQVLRDGGGSIVSQGFNLCSDGSANLTQPTDQPMTEPLVGPLADNGGPTFTHALLFGSPAINKGASGGLITDQRGQPRPFQFLGILNADGGDGSDIGALEAVNYQPVLTVPPDQNVAELLTLTVTNSAIDTDGALEALTFSLVSAPSRVTIDPITGVLSWTPTTAQAPSTNLITVQVTDNGSPPLSDTGSFTVVVNAEPRITQQPQSQTADPGSNVTFTVTASGTEPLSYQWLFNNQPLNGATSSSLELTNVTGANGGSYSVSVSNVLGTVPSASATLTVVLAPPGITAPVIAENGQFQFRLTGTVGGSYVVLASTNLAAWTPIATNVVPAAGFDYVTDPFATSFTQRFYRAVSE